ncbi:MAG: cytidine deaminase [Clostridiaceae bacterium]|nr:cytidine deaminase [Clostridiaceae bacterium]
MNEIELCSKAIEAMEKAYAPYSKHKVGAALLTETGRLFTGCNIENAAYSPTVCAERVALFTAVAAGERKLKAIAVAGGKDGIVDGAFPPCGVCRQVMAEFCPPDFKVLVVTGKDSYKKYTLSELLPEAFTPENIE